MALAPREATKFEVNRVGADKHAHLYKNIDLAALYEAYGPTLMSIQELNPVRKKVAKWARPNILKEDGTIMSIFEDRALIREVNSSRVSWKLYTLDADTRSTFVKNYEEGNDEAGLDGTISEVGLDADWFGPNDQIIFELNFYFAIYYM